MAAADRFAGPVGIADVRGCGAGCHGRNARHGRGLASTAGGLTACDQHAGVARTPVAHGHASTVAGRGRRRAQCQCGAERGAERTVADRHAIGSRHPVTDAEAHACADARADAEAHACTDARGPANPHPGTAGPHAATGRYPTTDSDTANGSPCWSDVQAVSIRNTDGPAGGLIDTGPDTQAHADAQANADAIADAIADAQSNTTAVRESVAVVVAITGDATTPVDRRAALTGDSGRPRAGDSRRWERRKRRQAVRGRRLAQSDDSGARPGTFLVRGVREYDCALRRPVSRGLRSIRA